jgi:hypothetical protein
MSPPVADALQGPFANGVTGHAGCHSTYLLVDSKYVYEGN